MPLTLARAGSACNERGGGGGEQEEPVTPTTYLPLERLLDMALHASSKGNAAGVRKERRRGERVVG